jgi:lactoylglutathione lyase
MRIGFVTIHVEDLERTIAFWREVMGFSVARRFQAGPKVEIAFMDDGGGHQLEFITGTGHKVSGDGFSVGFDVDDMDATVAHLKKHGVEIVYGPQTMPSGVTLLQALDPNGLGMTFVQNPR